MKKLKISELFYSLQGEGRYVGTPSVFLRTFGCNFTCGGFGMPMGEKSMERDHIAAKHKIHPYSSYQSLPLVGTGCDSYASWDPRFKNLSPHFTTEELSDMMDEILPDKHWGRTRTVGSVGRTHLVITGGEPLLGWQKAYPELLSRLRANGLEYLTFETNGTQRLTPELSAYLRNEFSGEITFSVSPKLCASGELLEDAIKPDAINDYLNVVLRDEFPWAHSQVYLKFVVDSETDLLQIEEILKTNPMTYGSPHVEVYLMPVGGTDDLYFANNVKVANMALKRGWKYSPRLQVDIWKNAWGT